ncbi:Sugar transporter [Operophtera brumata]|uniref:Sugar transporter n=1 Tax=Operophtera brumata TaxID=104452 RepID=A0A0L7K4A7_OPEBR|nr:Sugar transporter [Operophtera brumata]
MIYASFATGACCLLLGLQLHLKWGPNWLIAVTMYLFTMVYSFGAGTVPYVLMAEVFLPEVSSSFFMKSW